MTATKTKVSLTVATDLIRLVDREAKRVGSSRSAIFELFARGGASRAAERSIDELTAAYYASLRPDDRAEGEAIARASSRAAKAIAYDVPVQPTRRKRR